MNENLRKLSIANLWLMATLISLSFVQQAYAKTAKAINIFDVSAVYTSLTSVENGMDILLNIHNMYISHTIDYVPAIGNMTINSVKYDFNKDGIIDATDISLMAFHFGFTQRMYSKT